MKELTNLTDLEITKLCAEAMGYEITWDDRGHWYCYELHYAYYPLHDDAQAMALVKSLILNCGAPEDNDDEWEVEYRLPNHPCYSAAWSMDLNHAICLCVAKMQLSRAGKNENEKTEA